MSTTAAMAVARRIRLEKGAARATAGHQWRSTRPALCSGVRGELRTTEPSGWDRTSRMEAMLREARALDTEPLAASDVADIFATGSDGNRIVALALVEGNPRLATAEVLVDAILESRSTFEQYHALVAAEHALDHLSADDRTRVREAVESVLAGPLGGRSSDRRTVARRILKSPT